MSNDSKTYLECKRKDVAYIVAARMVHIPNAEDILVTHIRKFGDISLCFS